MMGIFRRARQSLFDNRFAKRIWRAINSSYGDIDDLIRL
jgi:hypothetical protein